MNRHKSLLILPSLALSLILLGSCHSRKAQKALPPSSPTVIATSFPSLTARKVTEMAVPVTPSQTRTRTLVTPSGTPTPEPTATWVRPEIYPGSPLSVQAEWEGSAQEPAFDWSPDGTQLVFSAADGVRLITTDTFRPIWKGPTGKSVAFSADGEHVAIATGERIEIHAAADGKLESSVTEAPCAQAEWTGFQPNGGSLVVARVNHETSTAEFSWVDLGKGSCSPPFAAVKGTPNITIPSISLSKEKDFLLAVVENQVFLWDTASGQEAIHLQGQAAAFNPAGYLFAVRDRDTITVFVLSTREALQTFQIPNSQVIALGGAQSMLAVSSPDGSNQQVGFYDAEYNHLLRILRDLPGDTQTLSFSPGDQRLLVIAKKAGASQPSRFLMLGLYSGLVTTSQNTPGSFQVTRPATTPAPLFPILYPPINGQGEFAAPIATPAGDAQVYRLKAWNADLGTALLQPLITFATENDVFGPGSSRAGFFVPQNAVRLAAQEYLLRFPNAPQAAAVQWRLALANNILNRHDSDAWVIAQIEKGLNDGSIHPSDIRINASLAPFGFELDTNLHQALTPETSEGFSCGGAMHSELAPSLFGDRGTTQIVTIENAWAGIGIVAAIHQDVPGHYQVIPIHNSLNFDSGVCQMVAVQDLTGDGRPEIWVEEYWHSGSMDSKTSYIYQWRDGHFVDVSGGQISCFDAPYEIKITGTTGQAKTIAYTFHNLGSGSGTSILKWDGEQFTTQYASSQIILDQDGKINSPFLLEAIDDGKYSDVSRQLRSFLRNNANTQPLQPEDIANLTFTLAVSEALQFKADEARTVLQTWLQSKQAADPRASSYKDAAQTFLKVYQNKTDIYRACQAEQALLSDLPNPCSLSAAFRELARRAALQGTADLPRTLEGDGLRFTFTSSFDANGDSKPDWILITERAQDSHGKTPVLFLISNKAAYESIFQTIFSQPPPVELKAIHLPGSNVSAYLLRIGEMIEIFRIRSESQAVRIETLQYVSNDSGYQERSEADSFDLFVLHETEYYTLPEMIHWDAQSGQFLSYDYAETLVLMNNQPREAISAIPSLIDKLKTLPEDDYTRLSQLPRLQYLLGLAYELTGDKANAAQVYYDLWHSSSYGHYERPEQPYVILAREKLEQVQP